MMKTNSIRSKLSLIGCIVLIAAMALFTTGCGGNEPPATEATISTFTFVAVDLDGNETSFEITTDKATVGEALLAEGLIAGDDGEYGLYVKEVNGIVADYEVDGTYWAFYVNGEYAIEGIELTEIAADTVYSLVQTKG